MNFYSFDDIRAAGDCAALARKTGTGERYLIWSKKFLTHNLDVL
jgi:hypothetical protein